MTWRVAKSLDQLLRQINILYPNRDRSSDGSIGDASHQSRSSDHNPWVKGPGGVWIVTARDFTNDPIHRMSSDDLAHTIINSRDERVKYVISNRRICSGSNQDKPAWKWRPYTGTNPHDHHCHVSVKPTEALYDDVSPWRMLMQPAHPDIENLVVPTKPVLRLRAVGNDVKILQALLVSKFTANIMVDGEFGPATQKALIAFQKAKGLVADGVAGLYTWKALEA